MGVGSVAEQGGGKDPQNQTPKRTIQNYLTIVQSQNHNITHGSFLYSHCAQPHPLNPVSDHLTTLR